MLSRSFKFIALSFICLFITLTCNNNSKKEETPPMINDDTSTTTSSNLSNTTSSLPLDTSTATSIFENTGYFESTGLLSIGRIEHTATLLNNGNVLIVGGLMIDPSVGGLGWNNRRTVSTSEIYNINTGEFSISLGPAGEIETSRNKHTATLLNDGRVLIVGGQNIDPVNRYTTVLNTIEIYSPDILKCGVVSYLNDARGSHTATLLQDGRVLIVGGDTRGSSLSSVEIYDPANNVCTIVGYLDGYGRSRHRSFLLNNGKVIIIGGVHLHIESGEPEDKYIDGKARLLEVFDPSDNSITNIFTFPDDLNIYNSALFNRDNFIIYGAKYNADWTADTKIFTIDISKQDFNIINTTPIAFRKNTTITPLNDNAILIIGDIRYDEFMEYVKYTDIYVPSENKFYLGAELAEIRSKHTATLLQDGRVLIVGGDNGSESHSKSALIYNP